MKSACTFSFSLSVAFTKHCLIRQVPAIFITPLKNESVIFNSYWYICGKQTCVEQSLFFLALYTVFHFSKFLFTSMISGNVANNLDGVKLARHDGSSSRNRLVLRTCWSSLHSRVVTSWLITKKRSDDSFLRSSSSKTSFASVLFQPRRFPDLVSLTF